MKVLDTIWNFFRTGLGFRENDRLRKGLLNALPFWIGAIISGCVAVLYARLFALAETGAHYIYAHASWLVMVITPVCFLLAWWLVQRFAPFARGSGIPQVSASIELSNPRHHYQINRLLSLRILVVKVLSSLTMVLGGGVVGREGPTIQISAIVFKKINDWLPAWFPRISKRNMIVTGAASGLAAAFNTPLGGIVFAIEELTKMHFSFFKSALLTGVIIAGLTALHFMGPYLYLGYPQLSGINTGIILLIIPLALITGLAGSGMGNLVLYIFKRKKVLRKTWQQMAYVLVCGLLVAAAAFWIDQSMLGSGKELMVHSLFTDDKHLAWYVPFLRILGPVLSFSTGAAGGIFAPSLSAGASIGSAFAGLLHLAASESNLMILCGMTGFLTGITRSPFTSSILVLEMTLSHNVIFFIMLTALMSNLIASVFSRHSFYDRLKDQYIREIHHTETQQPERPQQQA